MSEYKIITDSASDLPAALLQTLDVTIAPLHVLFRGETLADSVEDTQVKSLYDGMRAGEVAKTSAVNPEGWAAVMEPILSQGQDVLALCFSSGLSATYQSAVIAAQELEEKYPQRRIRVVDTLCAALGEGLLVWYACKKRDEGLDLDALTQWVEDNKLHLAHWFTVDDLVYLKRGGRISATTAVVGSMLQIKPVLHMDDAGKLVSMAKTRGRKASIEALAKKLSELGADRDNSTVFVCHADCPEDAEHLKQLLLRCDGVQEVIVGNLGAVIGSHAGPGTLAVYFLGCHR